MVNAEIVYDFDVNNQGSIYILTPQTEAARAWCKDHLPSDALRWARGYVVEHRYIRPIVEGILADGLSVNHNQLP